MHIKPINPHLYSVHYDQKVSVSAHLYEMVLVGCMQWPCQIAVLCYFEISFALANRQIR